MSNPADQIIIGSIAVGIISGITMDIIYGNQTHNNSHNNSSNISHNNSHSKFD